MTIMYFVRHGENQANLTKEFSYKLVDYPLTSKGVEQAEQTALWLAEQPPFDALYTSPLQRARQTAAIIAARLQTPILAREALREINVGALEGHATPENWEIYRRVTADWYAGRAEAAFPQGENLHQVVERFMACMREIVDAYPEGRVVVVGHGGVMTAALPVLCPDVDMRAVLANEQHNCSISEIALHLNQGRVTGRLQTWASWTHLHGEAAQLVPALPSDPD